jgi:two-component system cell cycle sensor histidine kinase/response regulator CckA
VVTFANQRMAEMLGLSMDELLGSAYCSHVHPDQRGEALLSLRRLLDGTQPSTNLERRYRRKDGSEFWGYLSGRRLDSPDGKSFCVVATVTDLSDLKSAQEERLKSEQQMLHVQKLESLGVLAGGIAHDFNNILLAIMGNVSLALYKTPPASAVEHHLHQIELAADKASDLSRQMLAYSGKGRFILEALDLNLLVREMTSILEVSITKKAALQFNLAPRLPNIVADPTQIRQIVMNLAINASEAIGERSGTISITTGSRFCDQCFLGGISAGEELADGVFVFLEVADDGCGMDRDTLQRIFEPFFTTKFTGRGLGMSAIQGIVRGHKGAVQVSSEPGRGSSFRIYLPASDQAVAPCRKAAELGQWRGAGTVLLVDDEEPVRAVASEMLRQLGFEVVIAVDGEDALRLYRENRDRIKLVLMDLNMPQLSGEETFHELRRINAAVRVVLSSGFSEQEVTRKFLGQGLAGFLQKPYTLGSLTETLNTLF